ncbi:MAG: hypothetical protein NTX66_04150, partial [Candidatus Falkowbacteria bacterium]|nr:hypothetical protein [Candidatus Falkowbacteria bacterium]
FSQTLKWCVYLGENSDWKYPMYFPHELVKLPNGLTEFREKSSPPAVWPNGIKYGDDTSTPDKSQGWNCVTSIIYTEVR